MAYRYITAEVVAVQPQFQGKPISIETWALLAQAGGVTVGKDGLNLDRHVLAAKRRGGNSWDKAQQAAHDAIVERYEQIKNSTEYSANHWSVSIIYSRRG